MEDRLKKYNPEELAVLMQSGSKTHSDMAFTEIYNRYEQKLYKYCLRMTCNRDRADDVFQEAVCRFYEKVLSGYRVSSVTGLLFRIARNMFLNQKRDDSRFCPIDFDISFMPEDKREDQETLKIVMDCLAKLNAKYREAFMLREADGMSYREIGEICGVTLTGAQSRVTRAREKLLKMLKPFIREII